MELRLTSLLKSRMRGDLIETFKIMIGICNYGRHVFIIFLELEVYCQDWFQKLSRVSNYFFAYRIVYFGTKSGQKE